MAAFISYFYTFEKSELEITWLDENRLPVRRKVIDLRSHSATKIGNRLFMTYIGDNMQGVQVSVLLDGIEPVTEDSFTGFPPKPPDRRA